MTRGIIISSSNDKILKDKILTFYKKTNRYIEHIDSNDFEYLLPSSKSTNVYTITHLMGCKKDFESIVNYFHPETNRIFISSVKRLPIDIIYFKTIYDDYFIDCKQFESGLMKLRFNFAFDSLFSKKVLDTIDKYIFNDSDEYYLHIFNALDSYIDFEIINSNNYDFKDKHHNAKVADFDIEEQNYNNTDGELIELII